MQWPCKLKAEGKKNKFWNLTAPAIALAWLASVMLIFYKCATLLLMLLLLDDLMNKYSDSLMTWIEFSLIKMSIFAGLKEVLSNSMQWSRLKSNLWCRVKLPPFVTKIKWIKPEFSRTESSKISKCRLALKAWTAIKIRLHFPSTSISLSQCHIGHIYLSKWWHMISDHRLWLCAAWSLDHTVPSSFFRT